jgi:hypothetical protein
MDPNREAFQFGRGSHFLRSDIMNSTRGHFQPSVNNPPQRDMSESNIKDFMQAAWAVSGACLELAKCVDALAKVMDKMASKTMASGTMTSDTSATGPRAQHPNRW